MSVNAVQSLTQTNQSQATGLSSLSADNFLTLLIAELRLQDPLSPMDTQALVQQLAQMDMVAEVRQARESQEFGHAVSLIGRTVQWEEAQTGLTASGVVSGIARDGVATTLVVDGQHLALDQVRVVR